MSRRSLALYDKNTGLIKQVIHCYEKDVEQQRVLPDHEYVDVTNQNVRVSEHMIDLNTKKPITRVASAAETKRKCLQSLYMACDTEILRGFTSGGKRYPSTKTDQMNMLHAAHVGGSLWCLSGVDWELIPHTSEEATKVLEDFTAHRDGLRNKLSDLVKKLNDSSSVTWN